MVSGARAAGYSPTFDSVPDGSGGVIVVWEDSRYGERNIYAQRLDSLGNRQWPDTGVVICAATGNQRGPVAASDGAGGAVFAWNDERSGADDIYVQRIDGAGAVLWTSDGIPACAASGYQVLPVMIPDGSGGVIIAWNDYRGPSGQVFAQRVNASGTPLWALDGVAVSILGGNGAQIVSDGAGGAIVAWTSGDVLAQRLDPNGAPLWTANGVALCMTPNRPDQVPRMAADGVGGACVAWYDDACCPDTLRVHAQHVDAAGVTHWGGAGAPVSPVISYEALPVPVSDGAGGAIVTWRDANVDNSAHGLEAQRIGADGSSLWGDGILFAPVGATQLNQSAIPDGAGGALVAFEDYRVGYPGDIYGQRVDAAGTRMWSDGGVALCTAPRLQGRPVVVSDGADGAIVTWEDFRDFNYPSPGDSSLYAQRVRGSGETLWPAQGVRVYYMPRDLVSVESSTGRLALQPVSPNPTRGPFVVTFTLPAAGPTSLEIVDLFGRRVAYRSASLEAGVNTWRMDAGRPLTAGIYLIRLLQGREHAVAKACVLR